MEKTVFVFVMEGVLHIKLIEILREENLKLPNCSLYGVMFSVLPQKQGGPKKFEKIICSLLLIFYVL